MKTATIACALGMLFAAGCGPSTGSGNGQLGSAVGAATAPYAILDLDARSISYAREVPDLITNAAYRDRLMVFRRAGPEGATFFAGVFEVTQAQWLRFGTGTPWTGVSTSVVSGDAHDDGHPVYNLDYETLTVSLAAFPLAAGGRLAVPSASQWTQIAGVSTGYVWGSDPDRASVRAQALVHESAVSETNKGVRLVGGIDTGGPGQVGNRAASPAGFYDIHGNVWEWTSPGTAVRGGSWFDTVSLSRVEVSAGAGQGLASDVDHALIGARLVLLP